MESCDEVKPRWRAQVQEQGLGDEKELCRELPHCENSKLTAPVSLRVWASDVGGQGGLLI